MGFLDLCVMQNVAIQIMVCDVSWIVTVLKRNATISMDVETFLQVLFQICKIINKKEIKSLQMSKIETFKWNY